MDESRNLTLSIELLDAANYQLDFLEEIENIGIFYQGDILEKAAYRYETFWLPLCRNLNKSGIDSNSYYPPLDVAWVWHCHMLSPISYIKDCQNIIGYTLDHKYVTKDERSSKQTFTKSLWESTFQVSFDYMSRDSVNESSFDQYETRIEYDLKAASERQKSFFYQVSLPHFRSFDFLLQAYERYKKFLYLEKINPSAFLVPCFAIDLIWHTHQLHPQAYASDTQRIIGFVFPHDDSVNERTPGSKRNFWDDKTNQLWYETYNEYFFFPGAMFRGNPPTRTYFSDQQADFNMFDLRCGKFKLDTIELLSDKKNTNRSDAKFKINIKNSKDKQLYETIVGLNEKKEFWLFYPYCSMLNDFSALHTNIYVKYKENLLEKLENLFKKGHIPDKKYDLKFDNILKLPMNEIELKNCSIAFKSINDNDLTLKTNWKVIGKEETEVIFNLLLNEFEQIDLKNYIDEYKVFEFHNKDLSGNKGISIRAKHHLFIELDQIQSCFYTIEIIHVLSFKWSAIKILIGEKLMATSHFINSNQLPSQQQLIGCSLTLDTDCEKAMLIRNLYGDFAIVKGKWTSLIKETSSRYSKKELFDNSDCLSIIIYFCKTKEILEMSIDDDFNFNLNHAGINCEVDLKSGKIIAQLDKLKDNPIENVNVESMLALIMSISMLYVFLQSQQTNNVQIKSLINIKNTFSNALGMHRDMDKHNNVFLDSVGYIPLILYWNKHF